MQLKTKDKSQASQGLAVLNQPARKSKNS